MIYRLPLFAQVTIIQQMIPYECFLLSSLSKKSKRLVQRSVKKRVKRTMVNLVEKQIQTCEYKEEEEIGIVMWAKCDLRRIMAKNKFHENKWINLEYNGIEMNCRLTFNNLDKLPMVWCDSKHVKLVPLALQKYISELFGISNVTVVKMKFSTSDFSRFPDTTEVDHIAEWSPTKVNVDLLDGFLRRVTVKHSLSILSLLNFNPNSPILSVDHLLLFLADELSRECFLNFRGKTGLFINPRRLTTQDVIDFVKMWLDGTNTKLESMILLLNPFFARQQILEQFETKPWDPKRRDGRFKYPENTPTLYQPNDLLDCTQQVDIEREHDGLLATIVLTEDEFCFFVWHTPFAPPGTVWPATIQSPTSNSVLYPLGTLDFQNVCMVKSN
ncbi:hypothetical protein CAEBREN_06098 [Caenorhabditis brenneri]|uniref:F-box domain-containing protein n=1 Tax=Caenorhabditis brenneri TaxID=135651 RepID=G0NA37_CAEBE|nr:hypothetical protein CAEBREN_06098 [Caenorhabditis brenneri]